MNSNVDLKEILEKYELKASVVAEVLFPGAKHPGRALTRLLKGASALEVSHVRALATYIGVPMQELLSAHAWRGLTEDGCLTLRKGPYKAKLNYKNVFLSIYNNEVLVKQEVGNMGNMTLNEFTEYLDTTLKNLEDGSI